MRNDIEDYNVLKFFIEKYGVNDDIKRILLSIKDGKHSIYFENNPNCINKNADDNDSTEFHFFSFIEYLLLRQKKKIIYKNFEQSYYFEKNCHYKNLFFSVTNLPLFPNGQDIMISFKEDENNMFLKSELIRLYQCCEKKKLLLNIKKNLKNDKEIKRI